MATVLKSSLLIFAVKFQQSVSATHCHWFRSCHGLLGVPASAVTRLANKSNGAEVYLVGSCHILEQSAQTVKQVINMVKPNVVAVELCRKRAQVVVKPESETKSLYRIFLDSVKVQGGLLEKFITFIFRSYNQQFRALGIFPGKEFKVAIEESKRQGAQLVLIDDDFEVTRQKLCDALRKIFHDGFSNSYRRAIRFMEHYDNLYPDSKTGSRHKSSSKRILNEILNAENLYNRTSTRMLNDMLKTEFPEIAEVLVADRDLLMFGRLRSLSGKVVGVVGMGHMDGIERLWELAEQSS